jgi:hypothetical protein
LGLRSLIGAANLLAVPDSIRTQSLIRTDLVQGNERISVIDNWNWLDPGYDARPKTAVLAVLLAPWHMGFVAKPVLEEKFSTQFVFTTLHCFFH